MHHLIWFLAPQSIGDAHPLHMVQVSHVVISNQTMRAVDDNQLHQHLSNRKAI
jgi:hypothetical protein